MTNLLFENGKIRTGAGEPDRSRLLVMDGTIAHPGAAVPTSVERIDLRGGLLLPAFADGHAHPLLAGRETFGPRLRDANTVPEIADRIRQWSAASEEPWLIGGSYDATIVPNGFFDARWIDDAERNRPVVLHSWDYHTVWVNSAALRAAGIDANTPDPPKGRIVRRADGSAMGTLIERPAIDLVLGRAPKPATLRDSEALVWASERLAARGVTWVQEAWVELHDVAAWEAAGHSGRMQVDVDLAFRADPSSWPAQMSLIQDASKRINRIPGLTARTIKFFVDGIVENHTAHLLEKYNDDCTRGVPNWTTEALVDAVRVADQAGFHVHLHAIGDAAVRSALHAVTQRPASTDNRATIAHIQLVDAVDLKRFAETDVTLCFQPSWAIADDVMKKLTMPRLGPERVLQYRMRSVVNAGARISFGSDWPVSEPDVLQGIRAAVTRKDAHGQPEGGWHPEECLTIDEAIDAATVGVHYQASNETFLGTLTAGKRGDLVWLDRDIRCVPPERITDAVVLGTWRGGLRTF